MTDFDDHSYKEFRPIQDSFHSHQGAMNLSDEDHVEEPPSKRQRGLAGDVNIDRPNFLPRLLPRPYQSPQRAVEKVYYPRQHDHNISQYNKQPVRMTVPEETVKQRSSEKNEHLRKIDMQKHANKQDSEQQGKFALQQQANAQNLRQQVQHLLALDMQKQTHMIYLTQIIEQQRGVTTNALQEVDRLRAMGMQDQAKHQQSKVEIEQLHNDIGQEQAKNTALETQVQQYKEMGRQLIEMIEGLEAIDIKARSTRSTLIKNVVVSNANIEAAVDAREAEMRVGLSNLEGTLEQVKAQAIELLNYSNNTSELVRRLVVGAMIEHEAYLDDEEIRAMQLQYDDARPNHEVAALMEEKLTFIADEMRTLIPGQPDRCHCVTPSRKRAHSV